MASSIYSQTISLRYANLQLNCLDSLLCFDIEIQAKQDSLYLDHVDFRMYLDDGQLGLIDSSFIEPVEAYDLMENGYTVLGQPTYLNFFGFSGQFIYLLDLLTYDTKGNRLKIATGEDWSYLFKACFSGSEKLSPINYLFTDQDGLGNICPSLIFDVYEGGGFAGGSNGLEIFVSSHDTLQVFKIDTLNALNANWEFASPNITLGPCVKSCWTSSVFDKTDLDEIKIYPNPTNHFINIQTSQELLDCELIILNEFGAKLMSKYLGNLSEDTPSLINTENLLPGVYLMLLKSQSLSSYRRFIKL